MDSNFDSNTLSLSYLCVQAVVTEKVAFNPLSNFSIHEAPFIREEEEEDWEQDNFPPTTLTVGQPGGTEPPRLELAEEEYHDDEKEEELEDFLMGDDPAMYSDEFSGPEDQF